MQRMPPNDSATKQTQLHTKAVFGEIRLVNNDFVADLHFFLWKGMGLLLDERGFQIKFGVF